MLYINIRLKPITKAKIINCLYRVSLQKTFYTWNYKKAGAALVRTITSCWRALARQHTILVSRGKIQNFVGCQTRSLRSRALSGIVETTIMRKSHGWHIPGSTRCHKCSICYVFICFGNHSSKSRTERDQICVYPALENWDHFPRENFTTILRTDGFEAQLTLP